jgi:hypothetical protein
MMKKAHTVKHNFLPAVLKVIPYLAIPILDKRLKNIAWVLTV